MKMLNLIQILFISAILMIAFMMNSCEKQAYSESVDENAGHDHCSHAEEAEIDEGTRHHNISHAAEE